MDCAAIKKHITGQQKPPRICLLNQLFNDDLSIAFKSDSSSEKGSVISEAIKSPSIHNSPANDRQDRLPSVEVSLKDSRLLQKELKHAITSQEISLCRLGMIHFKQPPKIMQKNKERAADLN